MGLRGEPAAGDKQAGREWGRREQQVVEIYEAVTVLYSPATPSCRKHTSSHHIPQPAHGDILQTSSQKKGLSAHEKDLWIKNLKPPGGSDELWLGGTGMRFYL